MNPIFIFCVFMALITLCQAVFIWTQDSPAWAHILMFVLVAIQAVCVASVWSV